MKIFRYENEGGTKKTSRQKDDETVCNLMFSFNNYCDWIQFNQLHFV